ncbi:hypothetical protein CYY_002429 [Polysphondylium violaceum]|uniref:Uncharacterized protein n=1 Tax=Polysphondylium violaceum TaxID=133409 RepID=A0A8J4PYE9_9MYCE|nr:hypothetical protein CYY_002429 [Polysphondylium violaceum]
MIKTALLLLILVVASVNSISLDIHLQLDQATYDLAVYYNQQVNKLAPNNQVFLGTESLPHITLYLTDFQENQVQNIQQSIEKVFPVLQQVAQDCNVELNFINVTGQYGMWNVKLNSCLQTLSDVIVDNTYQFITPNQSIPEWVYDLPEPLRSEKIAMIQKYGSPNVFDQFQPHVTLAWDAVDNLVQVFNTINVQPASCFSPSIGIGSVGPYGTVLDNKYGLFNFTTTI